MVVNNMNAKTFHGYQGKTLKLYKDDVDKLMPTTQDTRKLEKLNETFGKLCCVTEQLQRDYVNIAKFHTVIEDYPGERLRLNQLLPSIIISRLKVL